MKFLGNVFDPRHVDAKQYLVYRFDEDREEQWRQHLRYLSDKIIALPQSTDTDLYTVEQLINMNFVGVYKV